MKAFRPHFTIHLGDVYFVGDRDEVETNCLGKLAPNGAPGITWPIGANGGFAMNGNHEMYANGDAYFDGFLKLGVRTAAGAPPGQQKASFFRLQNDFWKMIALDTGYNSIGLPILEKLFKPSCKLRGELLQWLGDVLKFEEDRRRGIVLLSHHQYFSSFDEMFPKPAAQLASFIDRPVLWFWGHEHRLAIYGKHQVGDGIIAFGRCVGHGGMPVDIHKAPDSDRGVPLVVYDDREYAALGDPGLDGTKVGFNGFANLLFQGNRLSVEYRDVQNNPLLSEQWEVTNGRLAGKSIQLGEPGLTVVADLRRAIDGT